VLKLRQSAVTAIGTSHDPEQQTVASNERFTSICPPGITSGSWTGAERNLYYQLCW
jgi:hypothetical protein